MSEVRSVYRSTQEPGPVHCPLCGLAHRPGATKCDGCGQALNVVPTSEAIREELSLKKRDLVASAVLVVGMISFNLFFAGGIVVVATAPLGWFVWTLVRVRVLRRALGLRESL